MGSVVACEDGCAKPHVMANANADADVEAVDEPTRATVRTVVGLIMSGFGGCDDLVLMKLLEWSGGVV